MRFGPQKNSPIRFRSDFDSPIRFRSYFDSPIRFRSDFDLISIRFRSDSIRCRSDFDSPVQPAKNLHVRCRGFQGIDSRPGRASKNLHVRRGESGDAGRPKESWAIACRFRQLSRPTTPPANPPTPLHHSSTIPSHHQPPLLTLQTATPTQIETNNPAFECPNPINEGNSENFGS